MTVDLQIIGLDPYNRLDQQTVPDGATIKITRTHDGLLTISVFPAAEDSVQAEKMVSALAAIDRAKEYDRAAAGIETGCGKQKLPPGHDRNEVLERLREAPDLVTAVAREINILRERQQNGHKQLFSEIVATKDHASLAATRATEAAVLDLLKSGITISMDLAARQAAEALRD